MFDEQPDGDIHGECALEIKNLHARIAELSQQLEDARKDVEKLREENRMLHCFLETIAFTGMSADESEAHARDALKQAKGATLPTERRD